jgi:ComF family protein
MKIFPGLAVPSPILCGECWSTLDPATSGKGQIRIEGGIPLFAPFIISDPLLDIVRYLKFGGGRTAAEPLSWWMARSLEVRSDPILVPVPLHSARLRERGYNQAALLAGGVASRLGLRMEPSALARIRKTKRQSDLGPDERIGNVRGAFRLLSPRLIEGADIVVVDDLVTTGATVRACLEAIAGGGAAGVSVLAAGVSSRLRGACGTPQAGKIGSS